MTKAPLLTTFEGELCILTPNDTWERMYCVLTATSLNLYQNKMMSDHGVLSNRIIVRGGAITDFKDHVYDQISFGFTPSGSTDTYVFSPETHTLKASWIEHMARASLPIKPPPAPSKQRNPVVTTEIKPSREEDADYSLTISDVSFGQNVAEEQGYARNKIQSDTEDSIPPPPSNEPTPLIGPESVPETSHNAPKLESHQETKSDRTSSSTYHSLYESLDLATTVLSKPSIQPTSPTNWIDQLEEEEKQDGLGIVRYKGPLLCHVDGKVYKEKYCVLRDWALEFYNSPFIPTAAVPLPELSSQTNFIHLIGTWVMDVSENVHGVKHGFCINTTLAGTKQFYLAAIDSSSKKKWVEMIKSHRHYAHTIPSIPPIPSYQNRLVSMDLNPEDAMRQQEKKASSQNTNSQYAGESEGSEDDDDEEDDEEDDGKPSNTNYVLGSIDKHTKKSNFLKATVSKKKRRFNMDGFDLDLTYISNRIIAMGFPSIGTEAIYRNDYREVLQFFEKRHGSHYKIYNLCSERSYPKNSFSRILHFPFDDHNPPAFQDILFVVHDICRWLRAHPQNVAGIHCKAGKGRTGLIISIILYYADMWDTFEAALQYYATVRTKNQKGVTIPSQTRYVEYFYRYICMSPLSKKPSNLTLPPRKLKYIKSFILEGEKTDFDYFVVKCNGWSRANRPVKGVSALCPPPNQSDISITNYTGGMHLSATEECFPVHGDVLIEFYKLGILGVKKERVYSFWFHTQFVDLDGGILSLRRKQIDKANKKKGAYDFKIEVILGDCPEDMLPPFPMPLIDGTSQNGNETTPTIPSTTKVTTILSVDSTSLQNAVLDQTSTSKSDNMKRSTSHARASLNIPSHNNNYGITNTQFYHQDNQHSPTPTHLSSQHDPQRSEATSTSPTTTSSPTTAPSIPSRSRPLLNTNSSNTFSPSISPTSSKAASSPGTTQNIPPVIPARPNYR